MKKYAKQLRKIVADNIKKHADKSKVIGMVTTYHGTEHPYLRGTKVKIVAVLKNAVIDNGDESIYTTISDDSDLVRAGGVTANDRIEVQPWMEKAGKYSFVTSDPKAVDLACFKYLAKNQKQAKVRKIVADNLGDLEKAFLNSYVHTMLWAGTDEDGTPLDKNYGPKDVSKEAANIIKKEGLAFLSKAEQYLSTRKEYELAGHDFFLTRNGAGAGFWDGDWAEPAGTDLTKLSKSFDESNPYVGDDGLIYLA